MDGQSKVLRNGDGFQPWSSVDITWKGSLLNVLKRKENG